MPVAPSERVYGLRELTRVLALTPKRVAQLKRLEDHGHELGHRSARHDADAFPLPALEKVGRLRDPLLQPADRSHSVLHLLEVSVDLSRRQG